MLTYIPLPETTFTDPGCNPGKIAEPDGGHSYCHVRSGGFLFVIFCTFLYRLLLLWSGSYFHQRAFNIKSALLYLRHRIDQSRLVIRTSSRASLCHLGACALTCELGNGRHGIVDPLTALLTGLVVLSITSCSRRQFSHQGSPVCAQVAGALCGLGIRHC